MKFIFKDLTVETEQNNLPKWDEKLSRFIGEYDCYFIKDMTDEFSRLVEESGITNGTFVAQAMHTTCILCVNEMEEPMLLGDICRYMEKNIPKVSDYLHNSPL